ncbi:MAG: hypothetical protein WCR52_17725 [Bacteroidota bacterium]
MKEQESLDDELQGLSPFLRDLKRKDDGMKVHPDYFDAFESELFRKIEAGGARRPAQMTVVGGKAKRGFFMQVRVWASVAAVMAAILAAWWFFQPKATDAVSSTQMAMQLSDEEVESYVLNNIQEFDTEQLAALPDNELVPAPATQEPKANPTKKKRPELDVAPEDLEKVLKDMSDDELEQLL